MPSKIGGSLITALLICVSITLHGCRAAGASGQQTSLENLVQEKLGKEYVMEMNSSKRFGLCYQKQYSDHSQRVYQFIVVSTASKTVLKEGSFRNGYVKWIDDDSIEILTIPDLRSEGTKQIINITENRN